MRKFISIVLLLFLFAGMRAFVPDVDIGQTEQQETVQLQQTGEFINPLDCATGHIDMISIFREAQDRTELELIYPNVKINRRFNFSDLYIHPRFNLYDAPKIGTNTNFT